MADWVDSLSDDEVKALFKFKQGGVDSLSDAEVQLMYPHKDKLISAPSMAEPLVGNGEGFWDKAVGVGQAAAQVVSGGVGMVGAIVPTALQKLNDPSGVDFEKQYAENINRFTYEPTREKGQEYANVAGEFINRNLVPLAPVLHGIPSIKASEAGNAVRSRLRTNEVPPSSLSSLKAEIAAPEPVKAPVDPQLAMFKAQAEAKQKALQEAAAAKGQQPIVVDGEGRAAVQGSAQQGPFVPRSPMEDMARQLGAEKPVAEVSPMVRELTRDPLESRAAIDAQDAAQRIVQERQTALEQEVAAKTALDKNAAERARQEQQSTLSPEHRAEIAKRQTEADILFDNQLKQIEQQRVELEQQKARIATEEQARAVQEAQRVLDERQRAVELEVTKQQRMDFGAAERARQEAATMFPGPLGSKHRAEWMGLKERAAETRKLIDEQARKTAEIERAWENRPNSPERAKARLDEEAAKRDMEEHLQSLEQKMRELANKYEKTGQGPKTRAAQKAQSPYADKIIEMNSGVPFKLSDIQKIVSDVRELGHFVRGLIETGHTTYAKAAGKAKQILGSAWEGVKARFQAEFSANSKISSPGNRQGGFISFGKKNTADAISKVPGMESIRKIGHAGIESAEQAISLAKSAPDVQQSTVGKAFNWLTKGGEYLKARVDNPVFHYAVDTMLRGKDLANAAISEKLHGEYLPAMRALSKQEFLDVADLLNTADMHQKTITPEMLAKHGVSEHVARAIETHQRLMSEAGEMVNRAREAAGKKPIPLREAYSSMSFKGNYRKVVTKDGEVVGVLTGETKKQLAKAEEWLKTNHPEYEAGALQDRTQYSSLAKVSPHEGFNAVLENLASDNPHMAEFQKALKDLAAQEEHSYMGMNKHTMGKKGVFGAEGRKPWLSESENAKALVENQAKYLENALSWGHLAEAATEVNKVLKDESVMAKHPNAVLMAEQYMRQALGINSHSFGKTLTQGIDILSTGVGSGPAYVREAMRGAKMGVNTALFAFNHVFLGLQLLQPLMNMPALAVLLKNHGLSTHTTGTFGLGSFVQAHATYVKNALGKELSAVESQALKYAKENHIYADDMIEHSTSVRNDLGYKASKVAQYAQTKVEKATRAQMFMAMVHLMKEAGVKPADGLFQQAHRFTDMGMNRMDALEKPQVYEALGPLGNAAYNLSSFKHNELSRWSLYVDEIARNGNVKSAAPLLTQMATVMSMAGVMGLPFFALASQLYDKITELLGSPRSLITDVYSMSEAAGKHIGDKGAYALSNGFTSILGPDVSRRLGLGDIAPDNVADAMFPGISKLGQIAASSAKAAYHVDKPEYWKAAAYNIAPGSLQGPADVSWFQRGDLAFNKNPDDVKPTANRTAQDTLMRKIGLTGINESVQKTKNYENNKLEQKFTELRKKAMNGVKQDYLNDRDMGQSIDKWIAAQGDPASFDREVDAALVGLSISPQDKALIKDAASKSLSKQYDLQRRTR